ncbi:hypothetical protein D4764_13G0004870, partial [Takifugu flavidus]
MEREREFVSVRACVCMRACVNSLPTSWAIAAAASRRGGSMSSRKVMAIQAKKRRPKGKKNRAGQNRRAAEGPVEPARLSEEEGRDTETGRHARSVHRQPRLLSVTPFHQRLPEEDAKGRELIRGLSGSKVKEVKEGRKGREKGGWGM